MLNPIVNSTRYVNLLRKRRRNRG